MKRILLVAVVLSLMVAAQAVHAIYLDSSWYAQITNANVYVSDTFPGYPLNGSTGTFFTTHIAVTCGSGTASFSIPQAGQAAIGEYASWGNTTLDRYYTIGPLSFDYTTYWTQPNLVLEVLPFYLESTQPSQVAWSSSRTGSRSGHVTIDANPNGYWFQLVVVPEPSGIIALGSLCGFGVVPALVRRRTTGRRSR